MSDVYIASGARTPIGSFMGSLSTQTSIDLGKIVIEEALERAGIGAENIDDVIMGQVLTAGCGQNPARQAALKAGISQDKPAITVNQVCGSGLRAVALAYQAIKAEEANLIIAGGQESMSNAPHGAYLRKGQKMGNVSFTDIMIKDGLWCANNDYHMGNTAENVASQWQITREQQDKFAVESQNKAEQAQIAGKFKDEITTVKITHRKKETMEISEDEYPRHGTSLEKLARLRAVFTKDGTVTAGNASGINDGAAAILVISQKEMEKRNIKPLARIKSWATAGVDPAIMGTGPIKASRLALEKAEWNINDLDLIEANEAFAAQACAVNKDMGWDTAKVNVNGGAIALGHPIGASGARILITLLYEMQRRENARKGLATLCIGGGMGIAMCVEKI